MELNGKTLQQNVIAIIPARYASTRLPGKLLREIAGKPLILHTLGQAAKAHNVSRVIVATDDERIFRVVADAGGEAVMTSTEHRSGSDRIAEVATHLPANSIVVNVQGDEPMISSRVIEAAVDTFVSDDAADIATTCESITESDELISANVVKVATDECGYAIYFSRSPIPYPREDVSGYHSLEEAISSKPQILTLFRKHTGLYVYGREYLLEFAKMPQTKLEQIEMLEQLRALENGAKIRVVEVDESSIGVDTPEDFERVKAMIEGNG